MSESASDNAQSELPVTAASDSPDLMPTVVDQVALARLYGEPLFKLPNVKGKRVLKVRT